MNPIASVPNDILIDILAYVPPKDMAKIARVCKKWHAAVDNDRFWKLLCERNFVLQEIPAQNETYKDFFKRKNAAIDHLLCIWMLLHSSPCLL